MEPETEEWLQKLRENVQEEDLKLPEDFARICAFDTRTSSRLAIRQLRVLLDDKAIENQEIEDVMVLLRSITARHAREAASAPGDETAAPFPASEPAPTAPGSTSQDPISLIGQSTAAEGHPPTRQEGSVGSQPPPVFRSSDSREMPIPAGERALFARSD